MYCLLKLYKLNKHSQNNFPPRLPGALPKLPHRPKADCNPSFLKLYAANARRSKFFCTHVYLCHPPTCHVGRRPTATPHSSGCMHPTTPVQSIRTHFYSWKVPKLPRGLKADQSGWSLKLHTLHINSQTRNKLKLVEIFPAISDFFQFFCTRHFQDKKGEYARLFCPRLFCPKKGELLAFFVLNKKALNAFLT